MSSDVVIRAEGLGKKYVIGHEAGGAGRGTFRDAIAHVSRAASAAPLPTWRAGAPSSPATWSRSSGR